MKPLTYFTGLRRLVLDQSSATPRGCGKKSGRRSFRPRLEALEGRLAPASHVWIGAVNSLWSNPNNWGAGGTPLGDPGATIVFDSRAIRRASVNDAGTFSVNAIQFTGAGFTLSNSVANTHLTIGAGGISSNSSSGVNIISSDLIVDATRSVVSKTAGGALELSGAVSGAGGLSKGGPGVVILSGASANTYTGPTAVNDGLLRLNKSAVNGAVPGDLTIGNALGIIPLGSLPPKVMLDANNQIANGGTVFVKRNGTLNLDNNLDFIGPLDMDGGSILLGSGSLILLGDVTATSESSTGASISGATGSSVALFNASTTFTVNDGPAADDLTIAARVTGGDGQALVKEGAGQLTFSAANPYTGPTTINGGVLRITDASGLGGPTGSGTTVAAGATLDLAIPRVSVSTLATVNERLTLSGTGVGNSGALRVSGGDPVIWAGNITLAGDSTINTQGRDLTVSGTIDGSGGLTKAGASTLDLQVPNPYAGSTAVNAGTLRFDNPNSLGLSTSTITVDGGATLSQVGSFSTSRPVQLADQATLAASNGGSGAIPVWSGNVTLLGEGFLDGFFNLSGVLKGPGGPSVIGFVTFTGTQSNTYSGVTRVGDFLNLNRPGATCVPGELHIGEPPVVSSDADSTIVPTVLVSANEQISDTAPISVLGIGALAVGSNDTETIGPLTLTRGSVGSDSGGLVVLRGNVTVNSSASAGGLFPSSFENVSLGSATRTFTFTDPNAILNVTGNLSGAPGAGVIMSGPGLMMVTGASTYNGPTTVDGGTFQATPFRDPQGTVVQSLQSAVTVNAGGAFAGGDASSAPAPAVQGIQSVGGAVGPGIASNFAGNLLPPRPAVLSSNGNVALDAASHFAVDLQGVGFGLTNDKLKVLGTVSLGGSTLDVTLSQNFSAHAGDEFIVIDNDGTDPIPDVFSNLPVGDLSGPNVNPSRSTITVASPIGPATFSIVYNAGPADGGDGNDVALKLISVGGGPMFTNRQVTRVISEGAVATLTGTIVEPNRNDTFVLNVEWGDGTPVQTFDFGPHAPRDVRLQHRYLDNPQHSAADQFFIRLSWHDQHSPGAFATLPITVHNVPPSVFAGPSVVLRVGQTLDRVGRFVDSGLDTWTATANYGDGDGDEALALGADKTFRLRHRYDRAGTFTVTVKVVDKDGEVGVATFLVTVLA
jgi:autotransporter-associated beta strand protein